VGLIPVQWFSAPQKTTTNQQEKLCLLLVAGGGGGAVWWALDHWWGTKPSMVPMTVILYSLHLSEQSFRIQGHQKRNSIIQAYQ
jgi:hypothetical protein